MMYDQKDLLDKNMDKKIAKCYINTKSHHKNEIFVIYEDGAREVIHSYNPEKYEFEHQVFVNMTKLEAVFYCDRKPSISNCHAGHSWH